MPSWAQTINRIFFSPFSSVVGRSFPPTPFWFNKLTLYYIKRNGRLRRREGMRILRIGRRHVACILTPRSLAWKWRYWDSPQWKVGAIHSHKFPHYIHIVLNTLANVMHTLLIRYAYVTHTLCIRYANVTHTLPWRTVVDSSGLTLKSCAYM